jgi:hypothetical protein
MASVGRILLGSTSRCFCWKTCFYWPEHGQVACELYFQAVGFPFALLKMCFYDPVLGQVACEALSELVIIGRTVPIHVRRRRGRGGSAIRERKRNTKIS